MFKKFIYEGKETNYSVSEDGRFWNDVTNKEVFGSFKSCEYHKVMLTIDGKPITFMAHRIVALTYIPNPDNLPFVYHKDCNPTNNKVENLYWGGAEDNPAKTTFSSQTNEYITIDENDEDWRDILNIDGYKISRRGEVYNKRTHKLLKGSKRNGYHRVTINNKNYSVHILVYEAFNGKIPERMVIDHINGIRDDNRLENLRCITQSENMTNAQKNGHKGQHKVAQYDTEMNFIKEWRSFSEAAREFGVTYAAISHAAKLGRKSCGFYWKEI